MFLYKTKMTYLRRSNVQIKRNRRLTMLAGGAVALVFAVHVAFPNLYAGLLSPVTSTIWKSESTTLKGVSRLASLVRSKYSLVVENEGLRREIASRDASALLLDTVKKENGELKTLLGREHAGRDVLGLVLSRPPLTFYDTLIVDVGTSDGIAIGDKVYAQGEVLIGDVSEVFAKTARVSLFSTPGRALQVVMGSSTVQAQATGRGGGNFEARLPVDVKVAEGDVITFPHIRSHVFGVVEKIIVDSTDSLQTILFKAPVNMHEQRFVEVETDSSVR